MELHRLKPRGFAGVAFRRVAIAASLIALSASSLANPDYETIEYTQSDRTITLTGQDMTIDEVIAIARHGARVELSDEARQRAADAYGLLLQGAAEGVPIYWFNRGAGSARHIWMFQGSPMTPENRKYLEERQLASFRGAGTGGYPPELDEEQLVRAMMAIRSNTMTYEAASPGLTQALLDLLNHRITPVVKARGSLGEGDLGIVAQLGGAMVGAGEVYYRGERMPASEALEKAGLEPLKPFGADTAALISTNVYFIAQTALLLDEAERLLNWNDLSYCDGGQRHEFQPDAHLDAGAVESPIPLAELERLEDHGHGQRQLSLRGRPGPHHPGPDQHARVDPARRFRVGSLGPPA